MRNVSPVLAPPEKITDPFSIQWLRSIQSSGKPMYDYVLGGSWRELYISESWKLSSDGVLRLGGHSIEFGLKVGTKVIPLIDLPVMIQTCWPRLRIHIRRASSRDRSIRIFPPLFNSFEASNAIAIEFGAYSADIAIRTRGLYSTSGIRPTSLGWSGVPQSPKAQTIVFTREKPSEKLLFQSKHADACVQCIESSDLPSWLLSAMAPAFQSRANRPSWLQSLMGIRPSHADSTVSVIEQCRNFFSANIDRDVQKFFRSMDVQYPDALPEVLLALKWLIANHPLSGLKPSDVASLLVPPPEGFSPLAHALAFAITRRPLPVNKASSQYVKSIRTGELRVDIGVAIALFAASGDSDLTTGGAFLVKPAMERMESEISASEWLALLYAIPAGFLLSGLLVIDNSPSAPFGVRSPLLTTRFAGLLTSRKDIEANRVRIAVTSGDVEIRAMQTWLTNTTSSSALCLHTSKGGMARLVDSAVTIGESTQLRFQKPIRISGGESLVISTVGAS